MTMEKQICCPKSKTAASSSALSIRSSSQTISKTKPKIRIIHIFAPEIIKTDAANFRELVQRLTGKPTRKMRAGRFVHAERVKEEEEEIWRTANSGGGFLAGFGEFDGFMHQLNHFHLFEPLNSQLSTLNS